MGTYCRHDNVLLLYTPGTISVMHGGLLNFELSYADSCISDFLSKEFCTFLTKQNNWSSGPQYSTKFMPKIIYENNEHFDL